MPARVSPLFPSRPPRSRERGVTLFEVAAAGSMLAISVLALSLFVDPRGRSRSQQIAAATQAGERLSAAVAAWHAEDGVGCPTVSQLVYDGYLDTATAAEDPWGERLRVLCDEGVMVVTSAGPDGQRDTRDDLRFVAVGDR